MTIPIKRWTSTEGRWLKMFLRTGLHPAPEKFFCLTFLKPITRRRKSMDIDLGISVLALRCAYRGPQISISNRTILYVPRNAISPYAARAIYFVFPGEHIFCHRKYVSIWRGAWWTRYNRHCSVPRHSFFPPSKWNIFWISKFSI